MQAADDDRPRVTPALLRRAETMCPRRLAHEHTSGRKLSPLADAGFAVPNRIVEDAMLWQRGGLTDGADRVAFPEPHELEPEQRSLYRALARGYLTSFPSAEADVADLGWSTDLDDPYVRLLGRAGIALTHPDGTRELRILRFSRRAQLLDDVDLRFAILRSAQWAPEQLHLVVADLLDLTSVEYTIDVASEHERARTWLAERLEILQTRAHRNTTSAGADCRTCQCIPGCPAITGAA